MSTSPGDTRALGQQLVPLLREGDVLLLSGDLGAGKSEFCRGLARGLGIEGPIPSPSFTILNLYQSGSMPLKHFDWYRIHSPEELYESGLDEQIGGDGITAIEWHAQAPELLPADCLEVQLQPVEGDASKRRISLLPRGQFRRLDWPGTQAKEDSP